MTCDNPRIVGVWFIKSLPSPLESPLPHAGEGSVPNVCIMALPRPLVGEGAGRVRVSFESQGYTLFFITKKKDFIGRMKTVVTKSSNAELASLPIKIMNTFLEFFERFRKRAPSEADTEMLAVLITEYRTRQNQHPRLFSSIP